MNRYVRPSREDFYNQFITLNKTNKQLCDYYGCSENVIHRWKNFYKLTKPIELVVKSYKHRGMFKKGFKPWNKGNKGVCSKGCEKTWFTSEQLLEKAKKSIGVPRKTKDSMICLTEEKHLVLDRRNGKMYNHRKRIPYARYVLQKNGIDIPKGYIVYHKDGDMENNALCNLEIISRAELLKRNQRR